MLRPYAQALFLTIAIGCNREPIEKPTAPDMSDLVAAYEAPTGAFDVARVEDLRAAFAARAEELEQSGLVNELEDALAQLVAQAEQAEAEADEEADVPARRLQGFEGDGFIRVTRICDGWGAMPEPDREENGFMELVLGFSERGIDPVVWGTLEQCRYLAASAEVSLSESDPDRPALSIHLGGAKAQGELGEHPIVFDLNLQGRVGEDRVRLEFDFRVVPETAGFEFLVLVDGESLVVSTEAGVPSGVRARNGTFRCDADFVCTLDTDAGVE